jgi:hypothetical protein
MSGHWTERLSEYLDGELPDGERVRAERHLAECAECATVLAELREVVASARLLPDREPARDLWPGIRSGLTPRGAAGATGATGAIGATAGRWWAVRGGRRGVGVVLTVPQLVAAGVALVALTAGGMWAAVGRADGPVAGGGVAGVAGVASEPASVAQLVAAFEPAMAELEQEYAQRRDLLDPETIVVVEKNLTMIDAAIAEVREALAQDPASRFLSGHLSENLRRRMNVLRQVTNI